jgi:SAM-dependent methyltransferase
MLHGNKASEFKHLGANDVYHTDYTAMPLIFQHIEIQPQDVLVDVGCGKGRVINYWLSRNYQNQIFGLELDPEIAAATARQFYRRSNVRILAGDAIGNLPPGGTVFYFYNPFRADKVREFEKTLRNTTGDHKVTILYYNPKNLHIFDNPIWSVRKINFEQDLGIQRWGRLNKFHDLAVITKNYH